MSDIQIVIGSWGSYNECNERALGSKWLDLSMYTDWSQIEEELVKQGFELDGMDEELFIQDIEGIPTDSGNWDYENPQQLFEMLYEAEVLDNTRKYDLFCAYLEVESLSGFRDLVDRYGSRWDDDIVLYHGYDWEDYGREMFDLMHEPGKYEDLRSLRPLCPYCPAKGETLAPSDTATKQSRSL